MSLHFVILSFYSRQVFVLGIGKIVNNILIILLFLSYRLYLCAKNIAGWTACDLALMIFITHLSLLKGVTIFPVYFSFSINVSSGTVIIIWLLCALVAAQLCILTLHSILPKFFGLFCFIILLSGIHLHILQTVSLLAMCMILM